jgi:predicted 3-demethylubiquinone-9 3-methyltransferase (glyoxalase superfamily)
MEIMKSNQNKNTGTLQKITPFLWFDDRAEEAADLYISLFDESGKKQVTRYDESGAQASGRPAGSIMTVGFELEGMAFTAMNGGPVFKINHSVSMYVECRTKGEIQTLWSGLSEGGEVLMALGSYPFSESYGWVQDRFGLSWQLILNKGVKRISPCLMFAGPQQNLASDAIEYYISIFPESRILMNERYKQGETKTEATVVHAEILLAGQKFIFMDSAVPQENVEFNEGFSLVVNSVNQEEVDYFWKRLGEGGDESAQQCGWLRDRFGFSWQVVPETLARLLSLPDPEKSGRVMAAMLRMKKIDIGLLEAAAEGV